MKGKAKQKKRVPRLAVARILIPAFILMLILTGIVEFSQIMSQLSLLPQSVTGPDVTVVFEDNAGIELSISSPLILLMLFAAGLVIVYVYHLPVMRVLGLARKNLPVADALRDKAVKRLKRSPLVFALPVPFTIAVYQVFYIIQSYSENSAQFLSALSGIYIRLLFFSIFISFICFLCLFFLQKRLIHSRYLSHLGDQEALLTRVPDYGRLKVGPRLFWGNAVSAFVPFVILLLFLYSSALSVNLRDLDAAQRRILIGADSSVHAEIKEDAVISYYDFYGSMALQVVLPVTLVFAYMVIVLMNRWNSHDIVDPLKRLREGLRKVGNGDLGAEVPSLTCDELGELAVGFNSMVRSLRGKERLRRLFDRYMTQEVAEEIVSGRVKMQGDRYEATVLFADIRGFTAMAEKMDPEGVFLFLNNYLERMIGCVTEELGIIDKFMGDGILAVFGVPARTADHADRAMKSALRMSREIAEFNRIREVCSEAVVNIGIGLNSGHVMAGNLGDERRQQFSVIGDTVNTASRVEGLTKRTGHRILLTESVRAALSPGLLAGIKLEKIQAVPVRGREERLTLYGIGRETTVVYP